MLNLPGILNLPAGQRLLSVRVRGRAPLAGPPLIGSWVGFIWIRRPVRARHEPARTTEARADSMAALGFCHHRLQARAPLALGSADRFEAFHGKEGVDGSSPSEGFEKPLQIGGFFTYGVVHVDGARSHQVAPIDGTRPTPLYGVWTVSPP